MGFLHSTNPTFGRAPRAARWILMEFGLLFFMAGIGMEAGPGVVEAVASVGPRVVLAGLVLGVVPLALGASGVVTGAAVTGTLSTTVMTTDLAQTTDDHYIGRIIVWTSGDLAGQATDITDYSGTNGTCTFTAVTEAPSNTDAFIIV